jgi:GTPase SAR1 family protein
MPHKIANGITVFNVVLYGPPDSGKYAAMEWLGANYFGEGAIETLEEDYAQPVYRLKVDNHHIARTRNAEFYLLTTRGDIAPEMTQALLADADAVIFFWDSQKQRYDDDLHYLDTLKATLGPAIIPNDQDQLAVPVVFCATKRKVRKAIKINKLKEILERTGLRHKQNSLIFEAGLDNGENIKRMHIFAIREAVVNHFMREKAQQQ